MNFKILVLIFLFFKSYDFQIHLNRTVLLGYYPSLNSTTTTSISLSSKAIATVDYLTFNGLTNLQTLLLYSNQISSLDSRTFNDLAKLTLIDLDSNRFINF